MKAVILAAGIGWRLGEQGRLMPKCLLSFGGETLLSRHLRLLGQAGIGEVHIGVGYQAEAVRSALDGMDFAPRVHTVYNEDFREGNVVTLASLAEVLRGGEPVLLMDADVLYDFRMLRRLLDSRSGNCFLLDRDLEEGDEPVKLCVARGNPIEFGKVLPSGLEFDTIGESVGFFRLSAAIAERVAARCEHYVEQGRREEMYESVLRDILLESDPGTFGFEDVTGLPWIEIDFPEDINKAAHAIMPALQESAPSMA